ncbi:MAG TPA: DNA repair protein RadC [Bacteroidia bacterium]|nr:DNA repair protein RadC [Bacteroidia bacterium]
MEEEKTGQGYATQKMPIKTWAEDDRPREKFLLKGRHSLSDAELMALIIGSGSRDESALDLCRRILASCGNNLDRLGKMGTGEISSFRGMGNAKTISLLAALELGRRRNVQSAGSAVKIASSGDAYALLRSCLSDLAHEEFWVVYLNRSNIVVNREQVSRGGMNATVVDPKIVFRKALSAGAANIILAHNHPSGAVRPSEQDMRLTRRLKEGAALLEIGLLDHIIVGDNLYFSFADEGLL